MAAALSLGKRDPSKVIVLRLTPVAMVAKNIVAAGLRQMEISRFPTPLV